MPHKIDLEHLKTERISQLDLLHSQALDSQYEREILLTEAIREGDLNKLDAIFETIDVEQLSEKLKNPKHDHGLRPYKTFLFGVNKSSRIAAQKGDVFPFYLHLISERYTTLIEQATSVDYLTNQLFYSLCYAYCSTVKQCSTTHYSTTMTAIVRYITDHLTDHLTLQEIAAEHDMHPVHLARKFKQETGRTFISYVNQQRIFLAKYYFQLQTYSLSEVAVLSGYNSHSYFTKVFKKITGDTPTAYIRRVSTT